MAQIDDYVKHIFREHNQEGGHMANLETGEEKVTVESTGKEYVAIQMVARKTTAEVGV